MEKKFTFYWMDGTKNTFSGHNEACALSNGGYSAGVIGLIDFIMPGEDNCYTWDIEHKKWVRIGDCYEKV